MNSGTLLKNSVDTSYESAIKGAKFVFEWDDQRTAWQGFYKMFVQWVRIEESLE